MRGVARCRRRAPRDWRRARRSRGARRRSSQSAGSSSSSSARGSARRGIARGLERRPRRTTTAAAAPRRRATARASSATAAPVSRSRPGVGLISILHATPCARAQRAIDASVGSGSPAYFGRMPAAGVEPRQLAPRQRVGAAAAARRALERRVVQQERDVVGGELHVELDHPVAVRVADAHRGQRVLGRELAGAAVRDEARIRPVARR